MHSVTTVLDGSARVFRTPTTPTHVVYLHSGEGEFGALPLFDRLRDAGVSVTAPELPGFGESTVPQAWDRVEDYVFFLRKLLDALDIDRFALMGASLGGWLAAEVAVWFPERVSALILLDPYGLRVGGRGVLEPFGAPGETPADLQLRVNPHNHDVTADLALGLDDPSDAEAMLVHRIKAREATGRLAWNPPWAYDPKLLERLAGVLAPTLVLCGADDGVVDPVVGRAYADRIPSATLETIPECGHLPALEHPGIVAAKAAEFLDRTAQRERALT